LARLALLGDKRFLFSDSGDAFVMFGVNGRSWVAMGDPVGPVEEHRELIWRFHALVEREGGWTAFHEVGVGNLPVYVDLGLTVLEIGEEARVDLRGFSLEGAARGEASQAVRRLEREGCSLEVLCGTASPEDFVELRSVSDAWLKGKGAREKRFSAGRFDEEYLRQAPVAVLRRGARVMAFASLWLGADRSELSVDLVRHLPEAPGGAMDALFALLMRWGREQGYGTFSLGMAPVAGLRFDPFTPLWTRLSGLLYRHAEHFYDLEGLRRFEDRFDPVWEPRYLVCPGGAGVPGVLADLASLVSGSPAGRFRWRR
jgi:phosphatidylglycerol lysyltransferase